MSRQPPRRRIFIGLLPALLLAGAVALVHARDIVLEQWQTQRALHDRQMAALPNLGRHRIDEIFRLRVEKRFLVLQTGLVNSGGEQWRRATVQEIHGAAMVSLLRPPAPAAGPVEPIRFNLSVMDYPAPKQTTVIAINFNGPQNQLTIAHTVQSLSGPYSQVILSQSKGPQSGGVGVVRLMINVGHGNAVAPEQVNLEAKDFATLFREHPEAVNRYLRPVLRELGQESVFAPEPMIAWQVFSDLWKTDPAVARQVRDLLPALNDPDYHARDAALGRLQQLGSEGAAVLIRLDRSRLTPEQNARIDRDLLPYAQLAARDAARLRADPTFLLDCLYSDDLPLRKAAFDQLRTVIHPGLQFDINADERARAEAVAIARSQLAPAHSP